MKKILLLLFLFSTLLASAQREPLGKRGGTVVAQNNLEVLGDFYPAFRDTTGTYPNRLGAIRWRPADSYPYVYASLTGQRWRPLIPVTGFDTAYVGTGLYYDQGVIKARMASGADSGIIAPATYNAIQTNIAKRLTDFQISGNTTKTVTLMFNDGTQMTQTFTDLNSGGGGSTIVNSGPLVGLFTSSAVSDGSGNYTISYSFSQQSPFTVLARGANTGVPSFQALSADFIQSGTFDPARLPTATAGNTGALSVGDFNRLFTRQSFTNPTGTVTTDIALGGQAFWQVNTTGGRTLAFANLRTGDVFKLAIFNASGASFLLTLPATSYVQGVGVATSITVPTGRSMVSLIDYAGASYWFTQATF